jgi:hypothetical protein
MDVSDVVIAQPAALRDFQKSYLDASSLAAMHLNGLLYMHRDQKSTMLVRRSSGIQWRRHTPPVLSYALLAENAHSKIDR